VSRARPCSSSSFSRTMFVPPSPVTVIGIVLSRRRDFERGEIVPPCGRCQDATGRMIPTEFSWTSDDRRAKRSAGQSPVPPETRRSETPVSSPRPIMIRTLVSRVRSSLRRQRSLECRPVLVYHTPTAFRKCRATHCSRDQIRSIKMERHRLPSTICADLGAHIHRFREESRRRTRSSLPHNALRCGGRSIPLGGIFTSANAR
jgi:hypothetical protein